MSKILYKNPAVSMYALTEEDFTKYVEHISKEWGDRCPVCEGFGRLYASEDRDVIEGFKLANRRLVCGGCGGSGKLEDYFKSEVCLVDATKWAEAQKRNRDATEFRNRVKSQLNKLKKGYDNDFKELVEFVESRLL